MRFFLLAAASSLLVASPAFADEAEWVDDDDDGFHVELSHTIGSGAIVSEEPAYFAGTLELGFFGYLPSGAADDDNDESLILGLVLGDVWGLSTRATVLANGEQQDGPQWALAVGAGVEMLQRWSGSILRMQSIFGLFIPEVGAMFRSDRDISVYLAWDLPFSIRMDDGVALDASVRLFAIEGWLAPRVESPDVDPWEIMMTVNIGVRFIE